MKNRRPITEDDLLLTEMMIGRSYGNLKKSIVRSSLKTIGSVGGTVRNHPYAIAGSAVGAGVILFGLLSLLFRRGSRRSTMSEPAARPDMTSAIFSMLLPVVSPYITAYLEKLMGTVLPRDRD